ncbi:MAG: TIGR03936 family radical SAM-associated protein [Planctomycetota bacterium]
MAIRFAVEGDLRFISHHDSMRLFERALARANLPVRFSSGFNPRPRLRLALPRPVGVASRDELLVVELSHETDPAGAQDALAAQMPEGITLLSAEMLADTDQRRPCEATFVLPITSDEADAVARRVSEFLASDKVPVERIDRKTKHRRSVDLRVFIKDARIDGSHLTWTQTVGQEGSARMGELLDAWGMAARDRLHQVLRVSVAYLS